VFLDVCVSSWFVMPFSELDDDFGGGLLSCILYKSSCMIALRKCKSQV